MKNKKLIEKKYICYLTSLKENATSHLEIFHFTSLQKPSFYYSALMASL